MLGLRTRCIHRVLAAAFVLSGAAATAAIAQDMTPSFMSMPPPAQFAAVPAPNPPAPPAQTNPQPVQADPQPGQATPPPADVNQQPAPAQPPAAQKLSSAQVDQLVAPVALYPDPILSQMLMASTYPLEVVEAAHWVQDPSHKSLIWRGADRGAEGAELGSERHRAGAVSARTCAYGRPGAMDRAHSATRFSRNRTM